MTLGNNLRDSRVNGNLKLVVYSDLDQLKAFTCLNSYNYTIQCLEILEGEKKWMVEKISQTELNEEFRSALKTSLEKSMYVCTIDCIK